MDGSLQPLLPLYDEARAARVPLVLATVIATRGSTYRKAGARMLVAPDGRYAGLLSGGCLEGDLIEHAQAVFDSGAPKLVSYDNSGKDDALWGLGAGCEGGMDIWLMRLDPADAWAPFGVLASGCDRRTAVTCGLVLASTVPALPVGSAVWSLRGEAPVAPTVDLAPTLADWLNRVLRRSEATNDARIVDSDDGHLRLFVSRTPPPRELLVIGAGPDAQPVVDFATGLGWRVTLADHRPAYVTQARFPRARRVVLARPRELPQHVELAAFDAAVIMTHHFATDLEALRILADATVPYVGLLGPAGRRKQLLEELGPEAAARHGARLHAPVGLDLGGRDPASIALAIVAEIQAFLHGKDRATQSRQAPVA